MTHSPGHARNFTSIADRPSRCSILNRKERRCRPCGAAYRHNVVPEITVLLADDHPRVREHVRFLLEREFEVVGAVTDGSALIAAALELRPDVVVTDLIMEPTNGLEAAAAILARCKPKPAIVMLTAVCDHATARVALAAGILGYVSKMRLAEDLIPAIEAALAGSQFLSELPPAA